jgi:hypothetical protein
VNYAVEALEDLRQRIAVDAILSVAALTNDPELAELMADAMLGEPDDQRSNT